MFENHESEIAETDRDTSITSVSELLQAETMILSAMRAWTVERGFPALVKQQFLNEGMSAVLNPLDRLMAMLSVHGHGEIELHPVPTQAVSEDEVRLLEILSQVQQNQGFDARIGLLRFLPPPCVREALFEIGNLALGMGMAGRCLPPSLHRSNCERPVSLARPPVHDLYVI